MGGKWSKDRHRPYWVEYRQHRKNSKRRKIPFLISYDEWMQVWLDSGHLLERGCFRNGYVMARFNDTGAYAVGNVKIILMPDNVSETKITDAMREMRRARMAKRIGPLSPQFGKPRSAEVRAKISVAMKRHRKNFNPQLGKPRTAEERAKISAGMKRYRQELRA